MDAQKLLRDSNELLDNYKFLARIAGVINVDVIQKTGETNSDVGPELCKVIKDSKIDHVFIGRSGMSKLKKLLLGSVSRFVVDNSSCDVTIGRTE